MSRPVINALLTWYDANGRHSLPWRKTKDPYRILISELMLQQTQVQRVIPKYETFLESFPTLEHLAKAERTEVLRLWQGLGYNSRAIRLHELARTNKTLPATRDELLRLPGIGPYTAGAVMIFAHGTPELSVDVNVERVLTRLFWPRTVIPTRKEVDALSFKLITDSGRPHAWHGALMDLGSAVCTARNPRCGQCPLFRHCKTRGTRPETVKPKQARFLGSNRWWRGQILKELLKGPVKHHHLIFRIKEQPTVEEHDACAAALQGMIKERIAVKKGDCLILR